MRFFGMTTLFDNGLMVGTPVTQPINHVDFTLEINERGKGHSVLVLLRDI